MILSFSIIKKQPYWIGLRRDNSSSPWQWEDDTPYMYENWGMNQPSRNICAQYHNLVRETANCDGYKLYICKMKEASGVCFVLELLY